MTPQQLQDREAFSKQLSEMYDKCEHNMYRSMVQAYWTNDGDNLRASFCSSCLASIKACAEDGVCPEGVLTHLSKLYGLILLGKYTSPCANCANCENEAKKTNS